VRFGGLRLRRRADAAPVRGPNLNDGKHKRRVARHPSIMRTSPAREYLDQRSDSEGDFNCYCHIDDQFNMLIFRYILLNSGREALVHKREKVNLKSLC
jgi:hypothetical protein